MAVRLNRINMSMCLRRSCNTVMSAAREFASSHMSIAALGRSSAARLSKHPYVVTKRQLDFILALECSPVLTAIANTENWHLRLLCFLMPLAFFLRSACSE